MVKIPLPGYHDDPTLSWPDRYRRLEAHYQAETGTLLQVIEGLERATGWTVVGILTCSYSDAPESLAPGGRYLELDYHRESGYVRVVDRSGRDFLYPRTWFT